MLLCRNAKQSPCNGQARVCRRRRASHGKRILVLHTSVKSLTTQSWKRPLRHVAGKTFAADPYLSDLLNGFDSIVASSEQAPSNRKELYVFLWSWDPLCPKGCPAPVALRAVCRLLAFRFCTRLLWCRASGTLVFVLAPLAHRCCRGCLAFSALSWVPSAVWLASTTIFNPVTVRGHVAALRWDGTLKAALMECS